MLQSGLCIANENEDLKSARKSQAVGSLEGQRLSCSRDCLGRRKDTFMSTKQKVGIVGTIVLLKCLHIFFRAKKKKNMILAAAT